VKKKQKFQHSSWKKNHWENISKFLLTKIQDEPYVFYILHVVLNCWYSFFHKKDQSDIFFFSLILLCAQPKEISLERGFIIIPLFFSYCTTISLEYLFCVIFFYSKLYKMKEKSWIYGKRNFLARFKKNHKYIHILAEVPGAAWVNLRPAEHLLYCKQFSKICLKLQEFQAPRPRG